MLWLAARQLLRLGAAWAGATALVFAVVPHALYWGHHNGFLQQGYALPLVALRPRAARALPPGRALAAGNAALLALPVRVPASRSTCRSCPLLGFAAAVALVPVFLRARRRGRARRLALVRGRASPAASPSSRRATCRARSRRSTASRPAWRAGTSRWRAADFFQFALGTRVLAPGWVNVEVVAVERAQPRAHAALRRPRPRGPRGTPRAGRERGRSRAAAGLVALAAGYFALAVKDPWSGRLGHTWNLFKLAQWGWPFVLLLAALAVRRLAPRRPPWRRVALALAVLLPASQVGVHWPWSTRFGEAMREMLPGATLQQLPALKQRIQGLPPGTLLVVGRPVERAPLARARRCRSSPTRGRSSATGRTAPPSRTTRTAARRSTRSSLERWDDPHVVPIVAGFVPFQAGGVEELGGGFARLLKQHDPLLVHVVNPSGLDEDERRGGRVFSMGKGGPRSSSSRPRPARVELGLTLRPYPGRPGTRLVAFLAAEDYSHRSVRLAVGRHARGGASARGRDGAARPARAPARASSTVVLVVDEGRGVLDAREPVTVVGLALAPASEPRAEAEARVGLVASAPGR